MDNPKNGNGWSEPRHMGWKIKINYCEASPSVSLNLNNSYSKKQYW